MVDYKQAAEGCSWPRALDDLALIAAIDGEAGPDVMAHLRDCPHCSERAHVFENMQGLLRKQLFRMFCPTSEELAAYQQGLLKVDQRALITKHLKECPHCTREFNLLEQLAGEALPARSPPPANERAPMSIMAPYQESYARLPPSSYPRRPIRSLALMVRYAGHHRPANSPITPRTYS